MKKISPLYYTIFDDIKKKIDDGEYEENGLLPTEKQLMEQYQVSRITVQKAMTMLVDQGYTRRIAGKGSFVQKPERGSSASSNKMVGLILSNIGPSFGLDMLIEIERRVTQSGYALVYKNSYDNRKMEEQAIDDLMNLGVKAIIIQPVHGDVYSEAIMRLTLERFPIVAIDRDLKGLSISFSGTDNVSAAKLAIDYAFDSGHTHVCFMCPAFTDTTSVRDRIEGFNRAYIDRDIPNFQDSVYSNIVFDDEKDVQNIVAYLNSHPEITCIIASEVGVCYLVKAALQRIGKTVPDDISLITFDRPLTMLGAMNITYVQQNQKDIGSAAFDLMQKAMTGDNNIEKRYAEVELVIKRSVKKLN